MDADNEKLTALAALVGGVKINDAVYVRSPEKVLGRCDGCAGDRDTLDGLNLCRILRHYKCDHNIWKPLNLTPPK